MVLASGAIASEPHSQAVVGSGYNGGHDALDRTFRQPAQDRVRHAVASPDCGSSAGSWVLLLAIAVTGAGAAMLVGGVLRSVGLEPVLALVDAAVSAVVGARVVIGLIRRGRRACGAAAHSPATALAGAAGGTGRATSPWSTRSCSGGRNPQPQGSRASSPSAAAPACRSSCAACAPTPTRSLRWSPSPTTAAVPGGCGGRWSTLPPGDFPQQHRRAQRRRRLDDALDASIASLTPQVRRR